MSSGGAFAEGEAEEEISVDPVALAVTPPPLVVVVAVVAALSAGSELLYWRATVRCGGLPQGAEMQRREPPNTCDENNF